MEPPDQCVDVRLARADRADAHGRIGALPLRVSDRDRILMDIETDESGVVSDMADLRFTAPLGIQRCGSGLFRLTRDGVGGQPCS